MINFLKILLLIKKTVFLMIILAQFSLSHANNIKIGSRFANQPIILGQDFMDQFSQLLITLKNLTSVLEGLQDFF